MNDLQKLLILRGITVAKLATDLGRGYHSVQKVVKGHHTNPAIRQLISEHLGLHYYQVWGDEAERTLQRLIREEIDRHAEQERARLRSRYLRGSKGRVAPTRKTGNG